MKANETYNQAMRPQVESTRVQRFGFWVLNNRKPLIGIAGVLIGVAVVGALATQLEIDTLLHPTELRSRVQRYGFWGPLVFLAIYTLSQAMFVPMSSTIVFLIAPSLFPPAIGIPLCVLGASFSMLGHFAYTRVVGGTFEPTQVKPWVAKILTSLDRKPIPKLIALRALFLPSPLISIAIAMMGVRVRDYALGSILGVAIPIVAIYLAGPTLTEMLANFLGVAL